MGKSTGFLEYQRLQEAAEEPKKRLKHWREFVLHLSEDEARQQGARCMDCGIPFCNHACPVNNIIPDWNDLVYRNNWRQASDVLHLTNNFPEFTGRICPAPCEAACTLNINNDAVGIKSIEHAIADRAWEEGWLEAQRPARKTGKKVAVVGSGPSGLACAQQLARAGHAVTVFEKNDRVGGLLRYGIPDFKLEKHHIDRRLAQMEAEGTRFRPGVEIGRDISWDALRRRFDAVVVATGATVPRDLALPGRELGGIHFAMDYLTPANKAAAGHPVEGAPSAEGKHVVIIGGGDTGSDCLGTALRQGAASVTTLAIGRKPPLERPASQPWPTDPIVFEVSTSHEEGGERAYLASTVEFLDDGAGNVRALTVAETEYLPDGRRAPQAGTERQIPADLVLVAMGFTGPETRELVDQTGIEITGRGLVRRGDSYASSVPGVFVTGDAGRGQSLIVWAIAEGRATAAAVDVYLQGATELPAPVGPRTLALRG